MGQGIKRKRPFIKVDMGNRSGQNVAMGRDKASSDRPANRDMDGMCCTRKQYQPASFLKICLTRWSGVYRSELTFGYLAA